MTTIHRWVDHSYYCADCDENWEDSFEMGEKNVTSDCPECQTFYYPVSDGGGKIQYINHYRCPCGEEWDDQWDCACNDRCPKCNKEIEPFDSELISGDDDGE